MSQLDLAAAAGTTTRHVSFLETGRSRPGQELVLRLATALDVPLRERNALLTAAGLPPACPDHQLSEQAMRSIDLVLDRALHVHEPYPAWVVGRGLQFLRSNRAAESLFPGLCSLSPDSIVDLWYGPGPFRDLVESWQDVVFVSVAHLRREATRATDPKLLELARRAEAHPKNVRPNEAHSARDLPVVSPRLKIGGRTVRTISAVMRFDSAIEVTASELRIELMFPADEESASFFRSCATPR